MAKYILLQDLKRLGIDKKAGEEIEINDVITIDLYTLNGIIGDPVETKVPKAKTEKKDNNG